MATCTACGSEAAEASSLCGACAESASATAKDALHDASEAETRRLLGLPPFGAMAQVSGASGPAFIEALGSPLGVEVQGPSDGAWLLRAPDHATLADALAVVRRPSGRFRVEVDPLRV